MKNLNMVKKYIRIVAGQYRRTPIPVVDAPGLRPTPDRVRETLYNWIHHLWSGHFEDKQVLDLFAGSGALGFEAASRGVQHVQMVEQDPRAIAALRNLRDKLKAENVRIHAGDVNLALKRMDASRFDLILLDPPFGMGWLERLWPALPDLLYVLHYIIPAPSLEKGRLGVNTAPTLLTYLYLYHYLCLYL